MFDETQEQEAQNEAEVLETQPDVAVESEEQSEEENSREDETEELPGEDETEEQSLSRRAGLYSQSANQNALVVTSPPCSRTQRGQRGL